MTAFLSRTACTLLFCVCTLGAALAQDASYRPTVYVQTGLAERSTDAFTVGGTLPWRGWTYSLWGSELRGHWDMSLSRWSFHAAPGRSSSLMLLGITPTLRLHSGGGRSAWFWEAGVGVTVSNRRYVTQHKEFSTRFNFASHAGVGVYLGARRQHERAAHLQRPHQTSQSGRELHPAALRPRLVVVSMWVGGCAACPTHPLTPPCYTPDALSLSWTCLPKYEKV